MRALVVLLASFAFVASTLTSCGGSGGSKSFSACSAIGRSGVFKIAGGESCDAGQASVAFLFLSTADGNGFECTGSYVSLTSVLTAAHCFDANPSAVTVASSANVRTGVSYQIHPSYDSSVESPFDMAVIKVDRPLDSAPLPVTFSRSPDIGEEVIAFGYGTDETGQEAISRIQNGDSPLKATTTTFAGYLDGSSAVVSTGEGSTCQGDSGGPVVAKGASGAYGIIGITRAGPNGCDAGVGRPSFLSSTQSQGAIDFLSSVVPDLATN